jgi:hypothetical protein
MNPAEFAPEVVLVSAPGVYCHLVRYFLLTLSTEAKWVLLQELKSHMDTQW